MLQLQKSGEIVETDELDRLRAAFADSRAVLLPKLLGADLLQFILPRLARSPWILRTHEGIGADEVLDDATAQGLLQFVGNAPRFLAAVRNIGACAEIASFRGTVYRLAPDSDLHDSWHDDAQSRKRRLIGMSINLSAGGYGGGLFQLREKRSEQLLFEFANTGLGDAILFRISNELTHRVTAVTGTEPRIAFAGWFCADAGDYFDTLRRGDGSSR